VLAGTRGGPDIERCALGRQRAAEPRHPAERVVGSATGLPAEDPHLAAVLAGRLRPSQPPPRKPGEPLVVYAESHKGQVRQRAYPIERGPDGRRRLVLPDPFASPSKSVDSRFRPLFVAADLLRTFAHEEPGLVRPVGPDRAPGPRTDSGAPTARRGQSRYVPGVAARAGAPTRPGI
jgi:hypothetical protein